MFREHGHEARTVDHSDRFNPTYCMDILDFDGDTINDDWEPDVIWASPPCQGFSVSTIGRNWNIDHTPKTKLAERSIHLVIQTLFIINHFDPILWFIENPRGKLRKLQMVSTLPRYTVTYCQYGDSRMKPTDIWTNASWTPRPMCNSGDPCHQAAPRGSKTGTQGLKDAVDRGRIPRELCLEILGLCEESE